MKKLKNLRNILWIVITPTEKVQSNFFNKFKQDFEPSCQTLKCYNIILGIPNNLGRIPTMEELKK